MEKKPSSSTETKTNDISNDETARAVSDISSDITADSGQTTDTVVAVIKPDRTDSTPSESKLVHRKSISIPSQSKLVHRKSIKGQNSRLSEYVYSDPTTTTGVYEYPTNYGTSSSDNEYEASIHDGNTTTNPQQDIPYKPIATPRYVECLPTDTDSSCQFYNRKKCDPPAYSKLTNVKFHATNKCSRESNINEPEELIEEQRASLKPILKTPDSSKYPDETDKTTEYPTSYFTDESTEESTPDQKPVDKSTAGTDITKYPDESPKTTDYLTSEHSESTDESTSDLKTIKPSRTTVESPTWKYSNSTAYLTSKMEEFGIVPDLLATYPSEILEVVYPNGVTVQLGNTLTPNQVKQKPTVKWDADPDSYYFLCMTDPDSPSREEPKFREWNHWLVGNIPGDQVNKGETLSEYIGAGPPKGTGQHRYVFLLYLQNDELVFKQEPRLTNTTADRRAKFSIKRIARRHKLGDPIAGNFFVAEWDKYVPRLYKQLNYPACLHLCQDD